ncbi:MAG TPA: hypothetical protein VFV34_01795 [Blastocatellia bacterium]|nr:hypothetical protein [Blastocatellia bacterium]
MRPILVSVSGLHSEAGKTSLLCGLLRRYPGWTAIKITRGHRRSCGREPDTCCVSPLLSDKPLVLSGREATFEAGKDTGRYWEAGAGDVHWVIATSEQVNQGVQSALERVRGEGVFIEGNSFLRFARADYSVMVAAPDIREVKSSALRIMPIIDALYVNSQQLDPDTVQGVRSRLKRQAGLKEETPIYFESGIDELAANVLHVSERVRQA